MIRRSPLALALAGAAFSAGCAASNPARHDLQPVVLAQVDAPSEPAPAQTGPQKQAEPAPAAARRSTKSPAAPEADEVPLVVGRVGDKLLDARSFLVRLWMRDPNEAREILEGMVFDELSMLEADRLGLRVDPAAVEDMLARALKEMERKLAASGSKLTPEEHVEKRLKVDFGFYQDRLRHDAIVQLLAERAVRAFVLENPRVRVRVMDLADEATLTRVQASLMEGGDFVALAREHGLEEARPTGGSLLVLVRSEDHPLARLAFATPVGSVTGPVAEGGRFLLLRPEERLEPMVGDTAVLRREVEASLARGEKIDNLEYVQWRAAMARRYRVDLDAFLDLVTPTAP